MPALFDLVAPVILAGGVSAVGYVLNQIKAIDTKLSSHTAADAVQFQRMEENFEDIKQAQRDHNQKLDRLIESLMRRN